MPSITITDLNNAKLDVDHIAAIATSTGPTATDRLGNVKPTIAAVVAEYPNASGNATAAAASAAAAAASAATATTQAGLATTNGAAQVALAATEKTAAEAARDAAIIGAGVYTTEALGRAAVADGVAFKVQGTDDIAAYEYRRVNAGTVSTLIATYPSKGYIDSGRVAAGVASTAKGAGYETIHHDVNGYTIVTASPSVAVVSGKVGEPVTITKVVTTGSATWFGAHIKIPYTTLSELNKILNIDLVVQAGSGLNAVNILSVPSDWNPSNEPVGVNAAVAMSGGAGFNLYELIMASAHAATYQAQNVLYIVIAHFNPTPSVIDAATATWTIRPRFVSSLDVIANKITTALRDSLVSDATVDIQPQLDYQSSIVGDIASFVVVPKVPLTAISAVKYTGASTATIDATYSRVAPTGNFITGYDTTLVNTLSYAYSHARIFDNFTANGLGKKFRFFVSTKSQVATISIRLTSGPAWGSGDGSIASVSSTNVTLNAENNYQASVDFDYSGADAEAFYAVANRFQEGYYILALDGTITSTPVQFSTYCCQLDTTDNAIDMSFDYALYDGFVLGPTKTAVTQLQSDVVALQSAAAPQNTITCWGDSLTAGGGWTDTLASLSGLTVYNGGTGGESSATILARQGGDVMVVNDITIPATTTAVQVASRPVNGGIKTAAGFTVTPLLQGGAHVNPCKIGGVLGTLTWTGASYADMNGVWIFNAITGGHIK